MMATVIRSRLLVLSLACAVSAGGCQERGTSQGVPSSPPPQARSPETETEAMIRDQLQARGIRDPRVLEAMRRVPRHRFVPEDLRRHAYSDGPLPIGRGQTISQPYIVALMAEALGLRGGERVLEVGSGSGYAAAVLAQLGSGVYGIELERELHDRSVATIGELGYPTVHLRWGDGFRGWPEEAPFDAIVLSCAAETIPEPLWEQLAEGGRLLYPRGSARDVQELVLVTKTPQGPREVRLAPVRFVPMRRLP
jgi:protein-L-isoaspartate(D-aspartate) O-methyltransferase